MTPNFKFALAILALVAGCLAGYANAQTVTSTRIESASWTCRDASAQQVPQVVDQAAQTAQQSNQLLQQLVQIATGLGHAVTGLQQQMAQQGETMRALIQAIQQPPPRGRRA